MQITKLHYLEYEGEEPQYAVQKKNGKIDILKASEVSQYADDKENIDGITEKIHHDHVHPSKILDIIKIEEVCYESYPCKHVCEILAKDNKIHKTTLNGKDIYHFYNKNNLHVPIHFRIFSD